MNMDWVDGRTKALIRLCRILGVYSGIWWYAAPPDHYAGDARTATIEKILEASCTRLSSSMRYSQPCVPVWTRHAFKALAYKRCAVDFESINPEAAHFWMKYFQPACISVNRHPEV